MGKLMGFFDFINKKKKVQGTIGYFNLSDWWLSEFSKEERTYIQERFQPLGLHSNVN